MTRSSSCNESTETSNKMVIATMSDHFRFDPDTDSDVEWTRTGRKNDHDAADLIDTDEEEDLEDKDGLLSGDYGDDYVDDDDDSDNIDKDDHGKQMANTTNLSKKRKGDTKKNQIKTNNNKRHCTTAANCYIFAVVLENDGIAKNIISYLDIKSLYQVSITRKSFASLICHEHVVRAALFQGGHAAKRIEAMIRLVKKRKIWTPSPLRLLRLMNGKRCEGCNQKTVQFNHMSDAFGVFLCKSNCPILSRYRMRVIDSSNWTLYLKNLD